MTIDTDPKSAALAGFLFLLPFTVLNAIVAERVQPFFSLIRPGIHTSAFEYGLLFVVILLVPIGAFIALRPSLRKETDGKRRFYFVNSATAALLLIVFAVLSSALGLEIIQMRHSANSELRLVPGVDIGERWAATSPVDPANRFC